MTSTTLAHNHKRAWTYSLSALVLAMILLCGSLFNSEHKAHAQPDPNVVEVQLVEYEIRMPTTLPAGPTTFRVTNNGSVDHNFRIEGEGIVDGFANDFPPGQTQILELDLPSGQYQVYSPIGNYADQGMRLAVTVNEGGVAAPAPALGATTPTTSTAPLTATATLTTTEATTVTESTLGRTPVGVTPGLTTTTGLTTSTALTTSTGMTDSARLTDTGTLTTTAAVTTSTAVTGVDALPDLTIISDTATITDTGAMTGTEMMLPAALMALMAEVTASTPTPEMQAVLDQLAAFEAPPIEDLSTENARKVPLPGAAVTAVLAEQGETVAPEAVGDVTHQLIPGPAGNDILLRILTPAGDGPFPIIVYYHGGGWVIAGLDAYEASARALANAANSVVVMVAYRQAPEHPFPAALEDAYAGYQWATENAADLNGDSERVAVAGESAGGNLATVVSLLAREHGDPLPVHQVLIYPVTQLVSADTPSALTYADAAPLNRAMLAWFKERYLPDPASANNGFVSPLLVEDLSGLPPATLITAEIDPLRSEGEAYAQRLEAAGVDVVYQNFDGVVHEFFGMGAVVPEAQEAVALVAQRLQAAFGETTPAGTDTGSSSEITGTNTITATGGLTATDGITSNDSMTTTGTVTDTAPMTDTGTLTTTETITNSGQ